MARNRTVRASSRASIAGKARIITSDSLTGKEKRCTPFYDNMVMLGSDTGKDLILDRLNGNNSYSLNITHLDIGTSSTPPAASDTQLGAAVARKAKATGTVVSNTVTLRFFFASSELANGSYNEIGCFVDGSASVDTGRIFNHLLFGSTYVKGTNEDTTIEVVFTLN